MKDKEKRNKIIFGFFIIFLMVSSTAGFIYSGSPTKKINGFKFTNVGNGWQVWMDGINNYLVFRYLPNEILGDFSFLDNTLSFEVLNENWTDDEIQRLRTILLFGNIQVELVDEVNCDNNSLILDDSSYNFEIVNEVNCFYLNGDSIKFIEGITYKVFGVN